MAKVCNFGRWPDSLCLLWCEGSVWAYIGRWGLALNKDICEAFCGEWSLTIWTLQHNWSLKNVHISMIFTYKVWIWEKLFCISVAYFFSLIWRWTSQFPLHISSLSHEDGPHKGEEICNGNRMNFSWTQRPILIRTKHDKTR